MDSMTEEELENPEIINYSRIKRIARGSGGNHCRSKGASQPVQSDEEDVQELE
ncbi:hypothetical protein [Thermococcus peptonophilus]|uniref:hypothetical protein n=1 Tax=Thermococcus peptonophilus TaxID=53952 RepID=UPI000A601821